MLDLILLEYDEVESDDKKNGDDDGQPSLGKRKHLATPLLHVLKFFIQDTIYYIYVTNTHRFDKEVDTTNDHGCDVNQYKKNWTKASVPVAFFHLAWSDVNQPHCSYVDQVKSSTGLNIFCINGPSIYDVIQIWDPERPSPHVVL